MRPVTYTTLTYYSNGSHEVTEAEDPFTEVHKEKIRLGIIADMYIRYTYEYQKNPECTWFHFYPDKGLMGGYGVREVSDTSNLPEPLRLRLLLGSI